MGEELLLAHMAQHLLIGDIAALLIVLGLTGPLLQPLLAIRAIDRLRVLAHPLVALPLWVASLYVWHIPALYQASLDQRARARPPARLLHRLRGADVDAAAGAAAAAEPGSGSRPSSATWSGVRFAGTVLGNVFMWSNTVFYPDYAPGEADFGHLPALRPGHRRA